MVSIRTSISCVPGDSGGPMFKKHKVIGVCVGIKNYNGQIVTDISIFTSEVNSFFILCRIQDFS
jgi:V8-like Glu-specific endopeptidase